MKTTLEISDPLLREARKIAQREHTTLRALVERGLRHVVTDHERGRPFRLRKATFKGRGIQAGLREGDWARIREFVYEGRGG